MKNRVSTICQKAWRQIKPALQNAVKQKDGRRNNGRLPPRGDAPQLSECLRYFNAPLSIPPIVPVLPDENSVLVVASCESRRAAPDLSDRMRYLLGRENGQQDIDKLEDLLRMPQVILEIGCGNAEAARQIALKNPDIGVIATDLYDGSHSQSNGSGYGKIARGWREGRLPAQVNTPANLVILKAETDLLLCLPVRVIDSVILINPEPGVGKTILNLLQGKRLSLRMKRGPMQIIVLPYSRELGLMACGGCGFEHDPDWSRGLGFLMGSGLKFRRGASIQWGVDLSCISAYTGNSTQRDVYLWGEQLV